MPPTSRYWLIDDLATAFSGPRSSEAVRYYYPKAQSILPITEAEYGNEEPEEHFQSEQLRHLAA